MASVANVTKNKQEAELIKIIDEKIATSNNNVVDFINFLSSPAITQIAADLNPHSIALILLAKALPALDFTDENPETNFYIESINALLKSEATDLSFTTQDGQNAVVLFIEQVNINKEQGIDLLKTLLTKLQEKAEVSLLTPLYTPIKYAHLPTEFNAFSLAISYKNQDLIEALSNYIKSHNSRKKLLTQLLQDDNNYHWALLMALNKNWLTADDKSMYLLDAIAKGRIAIVEALLDSGADVNYASGFDGRGRNDETPLMVAARFGHVAIVRLLITRGADINKTYQDIKNRGIYDTALTIACQHGHTEVVEVLFENGALAPTDDIIIANSIELAFIDAASNGHTNTVRFLLAHRDYRHLFNEALLHAASKNHLETAALLLDSGALIVADRLLITNMEHFDQGTTSLMLAARHGHEEMVNLLLDRGAALERSTNHGDTALTQAANYGATATVRLLLDRGADIAHTNLSGKNSLVLAAAKGHHATVELLINRGNYTLEHDRELIAEALKLATSYGHLTVVRYLITFYNYDNLNELLYRAAQNYPTNIMDFLLEQGADINTATDAVINANPYFCDNRFYAIKFYIARLQWFMDHGAQFSHAQYNRSFLSAVRNGEIILMQFLIDKGVDLNFPCPNNKTLLANALDIATKWEILGGHHLAMAQTLRAIECEQNILANNAIGAQPQRSFLPSMSSIASIGQQAVNALRNLCRRQ